jgi:hypothetical protein
MLKQWSRAGVSTTLFLPIDRHELARFWHKKTQTQTRHLLTFIKLGELRACTDGTIRWTKFFALRAGRFAR